MKSIPFRFLAVFLFLSGSAIFASAQAPDVPKVSIQSPLHVDLGKNFYVSCNLTGDSATIDRYNIGFQLPDSLDGVKLIFGPSISTSVSHHFTQGKEISKTYTKSFTCALRCDKPLSCSSPLFNITASDSNLPLPEAKNVTFTAGDMENDTPNTQTARKGPDVILRASIDRDRIRLGDSVTYTVQVLFRDGISNCDIPIIDIDDCFYHDLNGDIHVENEMVDYDGQRYHGAYIVRYMLHPLKSGKITIPALSISGTMFEYTIENNGFFNVAKPTEKPFEAKSDSLTLTVTK